MTRQKKPDLCDICGKEITSETQYVFKVSQKHPWGSALITEAQSIDCCHPCFTDICKQGYKPNWKYLQKNPAWVKGGTAPWTVERNMEPTPQQEVLPAK